jgi:thioester reductase-like protein
VASPDPTTIFLTGGTGCLGTRLAESLAESGHTIFLLVRPKTKRSAEAWLSNLKRRNEELRRRILLFEGDVCRPGVVLGTSGRQRVQNEARLIIHAAAITNLAADRAACEPTNVGGTENMLELSRTVTNLERLIHVSAGAVAGDAEGRFGEDELQRGQRFYNAYAETKFEAEQAVREAAKDLPITIVRPAHIVGDSQTGEIDRVDGVYYLILLLLRLSGLPRPLRVLPVAPGGDVARMDLVPMDFVVGAIEDLMSHPDAVGGTFHLSDPMALTVRGLARVFARELDIAGPLFNVPGRPLAMVLRGGRTSGTLRTLMDQLFNLPPELADGLAHRAIYDTTESERILGRRAPHIEQYVGPLLDYARARLL